MCNILGGRRVRLLSVLSLATLVLSLTPPTRPAVAAQGTHATPTIVSGNAALARLKPREPNEIVSERREDRYVVKTDNGYTVKIHSKPIFYESAPGVFDDIDNTIVPTSDGGFSLQSSANAWRVRFTDTPGHNQMRVDWQGRWFAFALDEDSGSGLSGYRASATANQVTYSAPGAPVSLRYTVDNQSIKEEIVLQKYTGKSAWDYRLSTNGWVPQQRADGHIGLTYEVSLSEERVTIPNVVARDAAGARVDGKLDLQTMPDGSYRVRVSVDPGWLGESSRVFPVTVDPPLGFTSSPVSTVISSGGSVPYTGNGLEVKGDGTVRSLVKFLPTGGTVTNYPWRLIWNLTSASITLQETANPYGSLCSGYTNPSTDCFAKLTVQPLAQDWFPSSATWTRPRWNGTTWLGGDPCNATNCPGLPANALSFAQELNTGSCCSSVTVDVSAALQRWVDGSQPNYGFLLSLTNDHTSQNDVFFSSATLSASYSVYSAPMNVSIASPADGSTLQSPAGSPPGTIAVQVSAAPASSSDYLDRVELFLDDNLVGSILTDTGGQFTFSVNPSQYVAGHHRVFARAHNRAGGTQDSSVINVTFQGGLMAPPGNLVITPVSGGGNHLTWAAAMAARPQVGASPAALTYKVERSTSSSFVSPTQIGSGLTATSWTDTSPGTGTVYYRARAANSVDGGLSPYSNIATSQAPVAPYGLVSAPLASGAVRLTWQSSPNSYFDPGIQYNIYRGGAKVASGVTGTTWTDTSTTSGATYSYQVSAVNQAGQESGQTGAVSVTAGTSSGPDAPTGVQATSGRGDSITVSWSASGAAGVTYSLYRSTDRSTWSQVASGISGWFYTDLNLTDGITYYYEAQATQNGIGGPMSLPAGAQAVSGRRLGIDSRWPTIGVASAGGTGYLDLQNGNLSIATTDSVVAAPFLPVVIRRVYNSQGVPTGAFGDNWRLNADWKVEDFSTATAGYAILTTGDGGEHVYQFDGTSYHPDTLFYWALAKDSSGNFLLTRPDRIQYHFNSLGQLASINERNGNTITYNYNSLNLLSIITDPVGRVTTIGYDLQNRLASVIDGAGRTTNYGYDGNGRLGSVTNAEGWTTTYQYDALGRLAFIADPSGRWTAYTYDDAGRVSSLMDGLGNRTTAAYVTAGTGGGTANVTDPLGATTTFAYESHGLLTKQTDGYQNAQSSPKSTTIGYTFSNATYPVLQGLTATNPIGLQSQLTYDATGNVTQAVATGTDLTAPGINSNTTSAIYLIGSSDLASATDAMGYTSYKNWSVSAPYRVLSLQDPLGNQVQYSYSTQPNQPGWVTGTTDANGNITNYSYDSLGNVSRIAHVMSATTTLANDFTYYPDGSVMDASEGYALASTSAANFVPAAGWNAWVVTSTPSIELPTNVTGALWNGLPTGTWTATMAKNGSAYKLTISNGILSYDAYGILNTYGYNIFDFSGAAAGLEIRVFTEPSGWAGSATQIGTFTVSATLGSASAWTHSTYDKLGRLVRVEHPDGSMEAWIYDPAGFVGQHVSTGGLSSSYAYDAAGRLVSTTDSAGNVSSISYDAGGNAASQTDANHNTVTMQYDQLHRVVQRQSAEGMVVLRQYDDGGRLVKMTSGNKSIVNSSGYSVTASYYMTGMLRQISEPLLSDSVLPNSGSPPASGTTVYNTESFQYNLAGKVIQQTDGNKNTTTYAYDKAYRLQTVTDAMNGLTQYAYDANGNRTDVWDAQHTQPKGFNSTHTVYDALNRVVSVTGPLGNAITQAYDFAGDMVVRGEPRINWDFPQVTNNFAILYGYDLGHRETSVTYPGRTYYSAARSVVYSYDGGGRRLSRLDDYGQAQYTYDGLGRLIQVTSAEEATRKGYDAVGNLISTSYSLGAVNYSYDADNRLTSVKDPLGNVTNYTYDLYGHLQQLSLPNGINRRYSYYALPGGGPATNRLQSISNTGNNGTNYWSGTYQYDWVGNVRTINASWNQYPSTYTVAAGYDNLSRVVTWTDTSISNWATQTSYFGYDAAGNRLYWGNLNNTGTNNYQTPAGNTVTQNAQYDAANRMTVEYTAMQNQWTQLTPGNLSSNVRQEPNGNELLTQFWYQGSTSQSNNASVEYEFDDANQMVNYIAHSDHYSDYEWYVYDGDGRRSYRYSSVCNNCYSFTEDRKIYEYDGGSSAVAEWTSAGSVAVWYVLGPGGEKLYTVHWGTGANSLNLTVDVYAKDHLGSVREVVNSSGQTANWYNYDPFGVPTSQNQTLANSYEFASAALDAGYNNGAWFTSFYNLNARLYNPSTGRFLSQDTVKGDPYKPWTQNLYVYAGNNPVNYIDPTGHTAFSVTAGGIILVLGYGVKLDLGFAWDTHGNVGVTADFGATANMSHGFGFAVGAGVSYSKSDVETVKDTEGKAVALGGNIAVFGVEVDLPEKGDGTVGPPTTGQVALGAKGLGLGAYVIETDTGTATVNVPDVMERMSISIGSDDTDNSWTD